MKQVPNAAANAEPKTPPTASLDVSRIRRNLAASDTEKSLAYASQEFKTRGQLIFRLLPPPDDSVLKQTHELMNIGYRINSKKYLSPETLNAEPKIANCPMTQLVQAFIRKYPQHEAALKGLDWRTFKLEVDYSMCVSFITHNNTTKKMEFSAPIILNMTRPLYSSITNVVLHYYAMREMAGESTEGLGYLDKNTGRNFTATRTPKGQGSKDYNYAATQHDSPTVVPDEIWNARKDLWKEAKSYIENTNPVAKVTTFLQDFLAEVSGNGTNPQPAVPQVAPKASTATLGDSPIQKSASQAPDTAEVNDLPF